MASTTTFDPAGPEYRCCCRCCHATTGAILIGILQLISFGSSLVKYIIEYHRKNEYEGFVTNLGFLIVGIIVVILLFIGIRQVNHYLVLPELAYMGLIVLLELLCIVICVLSLINPNMIPDWRDELLVNADQKGDHPFRDQRNMRIALSVLLSILVVLLLITIWLFTVFLRCYRFLKNKRAYNITGGVYYAKA